MQAQQDATTERADCEAPPRVVLDTNTVLDWLVFADGPCLGVANGIISYRMAWHATPSMRDELAHVLPRPALARWRPDVQRVLACFDEHVTLVHMPERAAASPPGLPAPSLACKDPDDQKFIDLAIAIGARWLFTRDRALLDLARGARRAGVCVMRPADWIDQSRV
ncbi:MAG: putative toxin-antitoxin system toxin component, PIN family [Rubrivivax sp.]